MTHPEHIYPPVISHQLLYQHADTLILAASIVAKELTYGLGVDTDYVERGDENMCHLLSISLFSKAKRSCTGYPALPICLHIGLRDAADGIIPNKPAAHGVGPSVPVTKPRRGGRTCVVTAYLGFASLSLSAKESHIVKSLSSCFSA